jgi:hypothetical protein
MCLGYQLQDVQPAKDCQSIYTSNFSSQLMRGRSQMKIEIGRSMMTCSSGRYIAYEHK